MRQKSPRILALALLAAVAVACGEGITDVKSPSRPQLRRYVGAELDSLHLVSCPSATTPTAQGLVTYWGGNVDGTVSDIHVPMFAVEETVAIDVAAPASDYLVVEFHADGQEHYTFAEPITVQIDYSRCSDSAIASHAALRVVYVDPVTYQPLEDMGGVVDSVARTITFQTTHFSSYAVAD